MSAIARDELTGEMERQSPRASKQTRERLHAAYEARMERVAEERDLYVAALCSWMPVIDKQTAVPIGWYADGHGLSFDEALLRCFTKGDHFWIGVCRMYGMGVKI